MIFQIKPVKTLIGINTKKKTKQKLWKFIDFVVKRKGSKRRLRRGREASGGCC